MAGDLWEANGLSVGCILRLVDERPRWWRLIALLRWWRRKRNRPAGGFYRVTSVTGTTLTIDPPCGPDQGSELHHG